jgi:hypothetical protein
LVHCRLLCFACSAGEEKDKQSDWQSLAFALFSLALFCKRVSRSTHRLTHSPTHSLLPTHPPTSHSLTDAVFFILAAPASSTAALFLSRVCCGQRKYVHLVPEHIALHPVLSKQREAGSSAQVVMMPFSYSSTVPFLLLLLLLLLLVPATVVSPLLLCLLSLNIRWRCLCFSFSRRWWFRLQGYLFTSGKTATKR